MKLVLEIIEELIEQVPLDGLKQWLLKHFNTKAIRVSELFNVHSSPDEHIGSPPSHQSKLPILNLFLSFAPSELGLELSRNLNNIFKLAENYRGPELNPQLIERISVTLNDYISAWTLISKLQQNPEAVVKILANADNSALNAFARLTADRPEHGINHLVQAFLIENSNDLIAYDKGPIVRLLRKPDFKQGLSQYLSFLIDQFNILLQIKVSLYMCDKSVTLRQQLFELSCLTENNGVAINLATRWKIVDLYQHVLAENHLIKEAQSFILLFQNLLLTLPTYERCPFIKGIDTDHLFLIVEHCLEGSVSTVKEYQHICFNLLFLLCSENLVNDETNLEILQIRLHQMDVYLFDTKDFYQRAEKILQGNALKENSELFETVWMQKLISCPHFIAASTPKILKQLIDRYYLYVLSQNLHDFKTIKNENSFELWLITVLAELEFQCEQLYTEEPEVAKKALWILDMLYDHFQPQFMVKNRLEGESASKETSGRINIRSRDMLKQKLLGTVLEKEFPQLEILIGSQAKLIDYLYHIIQICDKPISPQNLNFLFSYSDNIKLFALLDTINNKDNGLCLFHHLLSHSESARIWLNRTYEAEFYRFLDTKGGIQCFAEYLAYHQKNPWFADGLKLFAEYGKKRMMGDLLSRALSVLAQTDISDLSTIVANIMSQESICTIILNEFLDDTLIQSPQFNNPELKRILAHFQPQHAVMAIVHLNSVNDWDESSQYKFLMYVLRGNYSEFFKSTTQWNRGELNHLANFTVRHLSNKTMLDPDFLLGYKLLGELVFRAAQQGQTQLFYLNNQFNSAIARLCISQLFLAEFVEKLSVNHPILQKDWLFLSHETWKDRNTKKLPLMGVFVLNYAGDRTPLYRLIDNYLGVFEHNPDYMNPILKLMQQFPHRSFARVIFDVMLQRVIKNPELFTLGILVDMGTYFAKNVTQNRHDNAPDVIKFLTYLGQCKYYTLVQRGCKDLIEEGHYTPYKRQLLRARTEALIESRLQTRVSHYNFGFISLFIRLWHYGFYPVKNASKIVKYCDDITPSPLYKSDKAVTLPMADCEQSDLSFAEQRFTFIKYLNTILKSSINPVKMSENNQRLHHSASKSEDHNGISATFMLEM
ncbi:MAG: hypothetical protein Q8M40_05620 [Legionella sp.]|nr:hypothetical protein [Legionella sp.]